MTDYTIIGIVALVWVVLDIVSFEMSTRFLIRRYRAKIRDLCRYHVAKQNGLGHSRFSLDSEVQQILEEVADLVDCDLDA